MLDKKKFYINGQWVSPKKSNDIKVIDPSTEGYLFFYNFFSNLGEWVAKNGEDNAISAYLFNSSMLILAISYGLFYFMFLKIQFRISDNNIIKTLLMVTILLSLISFVLVAVFPSESPTFNLHIFFNFVCNIKSI